MRSGIFLATAAAVASVIVVAACHSDGNTSPSVDTQALLDACGNTNSRFTTIPVAPSNILGWVPLGNMGPPGHTFPTDHQYIYLTTFGSNGATPVSLFAPGDVTITAASVTDYSTGSPAEDYSLFYAPCREMSGRFGHVRSIDPSLLAQLGKFDQNCDTYSPNPGLTVTSCYTKQLQVKVHAGDIIGTTANLDLWLMDSRVAPLTFANPARWQANPDGLDHFHVVPISDYFTEPAFTVAQSLLGSFDGKVKRTIPPTGGTIGSDIPGTLQGAWINPSQPTTPEYWHMALVPDNVDPSRMDLSMGLSEPSFQANLYYFTPTFSGAVNRHPALVTPGDTIWCYEFQNQYGIALLQLSDATTLRFEGRNGPSRTCAGEQPWAFTTDAITFKR